METIYNSVDKCSGCGACKNICPVDAVQLVPDEEGFLFPQKNSKCIDCGLCVKTCPYNNLIEINNSTVPDAYAAYDEKSRKGSSSGGIFYRIADSIIEKGGIVYGAAFDKSLKLKHIGTRDKNDLQKIRGSKYLQSEIGDTFNQIKDELKKGEVVFFSGTPCQCAGLKFFLKCDYENLITADLICHGVPSQLMFDYHKEYLEKKYMSKLVNYQFRKNQSGWGYCETADFENKKRIKKNGVCLSPYLWSFMRAYTFRYSCYCCPFSKLPRQGDITLGDYWGVETIFPDIDSSNAVSSVLVNTKKGEKVWNEISEFLVYQKSNYSDVAKYNANLEKSTEKPFVRNGIYAEIRRRGYESVAKKEFRCNDYTKQFFKELARNTIVYRFLLKLYRKFLSLG